MLRMTKRLRMTARLVVAAFALSGAWAVAGSWAGAGLCAGAAAQQRLALVVGVDRYDNLPPDQNPAKAVRDALAVGAALETLGFEVATAENVARSDFYLTWRRFLARVQPGDLVAVHFSGLGVEYANVNYLVPADAPAAGADGEQILRDGSINLQRLYEDLHLRLPQVGLMIVDACRNNPLADQQGKTIGAPRGLGRSDLPKGIFAMYSAGLKQASLDGLGPSENNPNSVYIRTLLPLLTTPGLSLPDIARAVNAQVRNLSMAAGRPQTPVYFDETFGEISLSEGPVELSDAPGMLTAAMMALPPPETAPGVHENAPGEDGAATGPDTPPAPQLEPGTTFRDCVRCPEMTVIPPGRFLMGCSRDEPGCQRAETPQHEVTFARPFAVGRFAITFALWDACVSEGGCNGYLPARHGWKRPDRPVINVSREDALAYVQWIGSRTGKTYRLLTEAEREYVTRAGVTTPFWWGRSISAKRANYNGVTLTPDGRGGQGKYRAKTAPVRSFRKNPWGLFQVHGNVWEWVQDCWSDSYLGAPLDGSARWSAAGMCLKHTLRGGSWASGPEKLRASYRGWAFPGRSAEFGFRVARDL